MRRPDDDEADRLEDEIARTRHAVAVARFWLEAFADRAGFVWSGERSPQDFAREALDAIRLPAEAMGEQALAAGTGRMDRLRRGRSGFVEFHQNLARQAMAIGQPGAARAALRVMRLSDFSEQGAAVIDALATLRDSHASDEQLEEAVVVIIGLAPGPETDPAE